MDRPTDDRYWSDGTAGPRQAPLPCRFWMIAAPAFVRAAADIFFAFGGVLCLHWLPLALDVSVGHGGLS
jgi:hypothetical protein